jgi:uncharacterized membrane protein
MVIMALDHTRDFVHISAAAFQPENLERTTPVLFFTRWITHFCAPTFMLLAGAGAFLKLDREGSQRALARFLLTRGAWLILIELVVWRVAVNFSLSLDQPVFLLVLTALGLSMIALAGLIYLPRPVLLTVAVAMIVLHNAFDGLRATSFGGYAWIWNMLHQPGAFVVGGQPVIVGYPLVPWIGVMALGFCLGPVLLSAPALRRRALVRLGLAMTAGFLLLRALNVYGDPSPRSIQSSWTFTMLSFLRTTKYPPSLQFLLMTLGPSLLVLAWFDRVGAWWHSALVVIGRVPFFFYIGHWWILHPLVVVLAYCRYGSAAGNFIFGPVPALSTDPKAFPEGFGYSLGTVYLCWIGVVLAMYPLCKWFSGLKARRKDWWLSYL